VYKELTAHGARLPLMSPQMQFVGHPFNSGLSHPPDPDPIFYEPMLKYLHIFTGVTVLLPSTTAAAPQTPAEGSTENNVYLIRVRPGKDICTLRKNLGCPAKSSNGREAQVYCC
jgi:hypothetical protein